MSGKSVNGTTMATSVLERMKQEVPWTQTWVEKEGFRGYSNAKTGKPYGIIETLILMAQGMPDEVIGTIEEWFAAGYELTSLSPKAYILKEGQTLEDLYDEDGELRKDAGEIVYGSSAAISLEDKSPYPKEAAAEYPNIDMPTTRLDEVLEAYYEGEGIGYTEEEGSQSYYAPEEDEIWLPAKKQFTSLAGYLAIKAHESIHSTGAYVRCNREAFKKFGAKFGTMKYSREELIAEIGSGLLLAAFGLDTEETRRNVAAYCQNWLQQLQNNPRWIMTAAQLAEEAVEYIMQYA